MLDFVDFTNDNQYDSLNSTSSKKAKRVQFEILNEAEKEDDVNDDENNDDGDDDQGDDFETKDNNEETNEKRKTSKLQRDESFIKKNIKTQGKAPKRYIEKDGVSLYKCDHKHGRHKQECENRNKNEKKQKIRVDKLKQETEMKELEKKLYKMDSSDEDDLKLKHLKSKYIMSLEELAKAQNMIDSLRFSSNRDSSNFDANELKVRYFII